MEKFVLDLVLRAAKLAEEESIILNRILGIVDVSPTVTELRRGSFTITGGRDFNPSAAPMRAAEPPLDNQKTESRMCPIDNSQEDNMAKYKVKGHKISKRADGRWWARFRYNGESISVYGHSPEEVKKKLLKAITAAEKRKYLPEPVKTYSFFEWMHFWYDTYKAPYNKTDTILRQMRTHITVGKDKPIANVTTTDLQLLINKIPSDRTRVDVCNILKASFDIAFKTRVVKENPAVTLVKVTYKSKNGKALTRDEEANFLASIKGYYLENLFKFYLMSGCRRAEALKLNVVDVDRKAGTVKIHGTKTENSERVIPLFRRLGAFLDTLTPDENGYYFSGFTDNAITRCFRKECPGHKLHDLRHTFATRCLEAGVSMKTVQAWLGHADFETTANIYSHVNLDYQKEQALRLDLWFDTHSDTHSD